MAESPTNRFARFSADGELLALVAEGLPEWPADGNLEVLSDADIGTMHDAFVEAATELATHGEDADFDPTAAIELADRVGALRTEAERRMAVEPPADPPEPTLDPPSPEDRSVALARLTGLNDPPAPVDPPEPSGDPMITVQGVSAEAVVAAVREAAPAMAAEIATGVATALAERMPAAPR